VGGLIGIVNGDRLVTAVLFLLTEKLFQAGCLQLRSAVMITVSCKDNMASRSVGVMVAVGGRYAATQVS
jgi:hypothetical protein